LSFACGKLNELRSVEGISDALNFACGKLKVDRNWVLGNWELVGMWLWGAGGFLPFNDAQHLFNSPHGLFNTRSVFNFLPPARLNELRSVEGIYDALNFACGKLKWIGIGY